jgi:hypothetical protein
LLVKAVPNGLLVSILGVAFVHFGLEGGFWVFTGCFLLMKVSFALFVLFSFFDQLIVSVSFLED